MDRWFTRPLCTVSSVDQIGLSGARRHCLIAPGPADLSVGFCTVAIVTPTALSRSAVYALMAESRFPKPLRVGSRVVRWVEQEVLDFIASRPCGGSERPAA